MPVRLLPDDLINRIAAGEVVERPASVVKELVENAIDAGATRITVTTAGGGKSIVRVQDDGCGMDAGDLALCVERHATSKLPDGSLDDIRTMGFRGEALASIGSVATLSVASRPAGGEGLRLEVDHGTRRGPLPHAMNRGTTVEVKDLFSRVPARLKFLQSDRSEATKVGETVMRLAMANPHVHFVLDGSDRTARNWPATGNDTQARLGQVVGDEFVRNAAEIALSRDGMVVTGLAGLPTYTRANGLSQFFFVNGRSVKDKILVAAVRAAYADYVFRDRFPVIALYLAIDPSEVDVNVHPAKTELRFRDAAAVRGTVIRAVRDALASAGFKASSTVGGDVLGAFRAPASTPAPVSGTAWDIDFSPRGSGSAPPSPAPAAAPERTLEGLSAPSARVESEPDVPHAASFPLGAARAQMFENFIVAQSDDALVLVDQHAAHERLVYERFKAQMASGPVASQASLIPVVVELPEEDCVRLEEAAGDLQRLGLFLDRFGPGAVAVSATPALLGATDATGLVRDIADGLAEWDSSAALGHRLEAIIGRMACHGSVRSGRRLGTQEMNALLREMEATPHSGQCIHGRPTYVELSLQSIERLFGRTR